jgi:hypothetical protein
MLFHQVCRRDAPILFSVELSPLCPQAPLPTILDFLSYYGHCQKVRKYSITLVNWLLFFSSATAQIVPKPPLLMLLDQTQTHTNTSTQPEELFWTRDEHVAEAATCKTHKHNNTSLPSAGFETAITAIERPWLRPEAARLPGPASWLYYQRRKDKALRQIWLSLSSGY